MALIDKNDFQILRGGVPGNYEGCHDATLDIKAGVVAASGELFAFDAVSGKYDKLTLAAGAVAGRKFYAIIEGNAGTDSFAGEFTEKAAGLAGTFRMQTKKVNPVGMALGAAVTVVAGLLEVDATRPAVGEVISWDAVSGIAIVDMF